MHCTYNYYFTIESFQLCNRSLNVQTQLHTSPLCTGSLKEMQQLESDFVDGLLEISLRENDTVSLTWPCQPSTSQTLKKRPALAEIDTNTVAKEVEKEAEVPKKTKKKRGSTEEVEKKAETPKKAKKKSSKKKSNAAEEILLDIAKVNGRKKKESRTKNDNAATGVILDFADYDESQKTTLQDEMCKDIKQLLHAMKRMEKRMDTMQKNVDKIKATIVEYTAYEMPMPPLPQIEGFPRTPVIPPMSPTP